MANTIPLALYISAGSFTVPLEETTAQDDGVFRAAYESVSGADGWLLSQLPGGTLEDGRPPSPLAVDGHRLLPLVFQQWLLRLPPFVHVARPFIRQWVRFSFRVAPASLGVCRVYVLPDDECRRVVPRSDVKLRRDLQLLLNSLDYSPALWRGDYDNTRAPMTVHEARIRPGRKHSHDTDADADADADADEDASLLQMFNTIPSPRPQLGLFHDASYHRIVDDLVASRTRGLKATLHGYQVRSVAAMLQRELYPGRIVDPRLLRLTEQSAANAGENGQASLRAWYYDDVTGEVLRAPRLYDGVSGGILAEEMGTGKTLICLTLILATRVFPAEIPDTARVEMRRRRRIESLADMAATAIARHSVPWKLYLEGSDAGAAEYGNCIDIIKRNPATYTLPLFKTAARGNSRTNGLSSSASVGDRESDRDSDSPVVTVSACSLVLVPANLVRQWELEIEKHTLGLKVIVVAGKHQAVPSQAEILEADVLLFSIPRFEKLEQDRVVTRSGCILKSPLAVVHFKRVIVDEGHRLGNSRMGRKSNLLLVLDCLQVSARWIVTGTPSTGLFGVDDAPDSNKNASAGTSSSAPATLSSLQERKDLERIGSMASLYLRVRPWANTLVEVTGGDTPADWAVYVMQRNHSSRSSGRRDCLRATLDSLIIRHRQAETGDLLPAVVERVVVLDGSYQDRLCLNLFSMMIIFNAVQSQRTDKDYFFHPSQRSALLQLLSNMRQSTFYGAYFYSAAEIQKALETAEAFLEDHPKVSISVGDETLLRDAIAFGRTALQNKFKRLATRFHEVPIYVRDFPGGGACAAAWSIDHELEGGDGGGDGGRVTDLACTVAPMVLALQQFLRPCLDAPHTLGAMFDDGRFINKGRETLQQQQQERQQGEQAAVVAKAKGSRGGRARALSTATTLAGNTGLGEDGGLPATGPLKRRAVVGGGSTSGSLHLQTEPLAGEVADGGELAAALAQAQLVSTSSAKLSYLLDAIVRHQADEQMIVFYDNENVAFYLAEHLEILQIPHLIYAKGITAERRAQYVAAFHSTAASQDNAAATASGGSSRFRVLLMDLSQAAFGLDMWSASRVYFISPVLNPQVEAQAIGRVRRISQPRPVSVETLVLKGSVEEVIVHRRQAMTPAEHRKIKTLLDDRPIYDWVVNARILPLGADGGEEAVDGPSQMAPLQTPQFLFGRGFGRVEHPDEGLVAVERPTTTSPAQATVNSGYNMTADNSNSLAATPTESEGMQTMDGGSHPAKKRKVVTTSRVRFA